MTRDELIAKLEAATEGSRELDRAVQDVAVGFDPEHLPKTWPMVGDPTPNYTSSIDAALMLVPRGKNWSIQSEYQGADPTAFVWGEEAEAPTPALALCIAALKARKEFPMPKIETREALIEHLADWYEYGDLPIKTVRMVLDALDELNIIPCPLPPTTEMMEAAVVAETDQISAAIAASPYREEAMTAPLADNALASIEDEAVEAPGHLGLDTRRLVADAWWHRAALAEALAEIERLRVALLNAGNVSSPDPTVRNIARAALKPKEPKP